MRKGWLRPYRVARYLSVSKETVYNLIRRGDLEAVKIGGCTLISQESLEQLLERSRVQPEELDEKK